MMADGTTMIEKRALQPDADLACDFTIAVTEVGLRDRLAPHLIPPLRRLPDGIEVTFAAAAWNDVLRYVELESQCCPFLNLAAEKSGESVLLRVTGRPEAQDVIRAIFEPDAASAVKKDCC